MNLKNFTLTPHPSSSSPFFLGGGEARVWGQRFFLKRYTQKAEEKTYRKRKNQQHPVLLKTCWTLVVTRLPYLHVRDTPKKWDLNLTTVITVQFMYRPEETCKKRYSYHEIRPTDTSSTSNRLFRPVHFSGRSVF